MGRRYPALRVRQPYAVPSYAMGVSLQSLTLEMLMMTVLRLGNAQSGASLCSA
jgi:hypothetical protein